MRGLRVFCVLLIFSICWNTAGVYPQGQESSAPQLVIDSGGHTAPITALTFTNDDKYLVSAGRDKVVRVWDLKTGKTARTIRGEIGAGQWGAIHAADLTPNNRFLAVGGQLASDEDLSAVGTVRVHEFSDQRSNGEVRAQLSGLRNVVTALAVSPKNTYVAAGDILGNVCLWRLSPPAPVTSVVRCVPLHQERITGLAFSADEKKLVAGSWDKTLSLSAIPALQISAVMNEHSDKVISVAFRDNGIISSSYDGTIRQWNPGNGKHEKILFKTSNQIVANLAVDSQMRRTLFCSIGNSAVCEIFSLRTGNILARFGKHTNVSAAALSHDGTMAATAGSPNNEIYVWKTDSGAQVQKLSGVGAEITAVGFAKDGGSIAFASQRAAPAGNSNLLQQKLTFTMQGENTINFHSIVDRQDDYFRELHNAAGTQLRLRGDGALEIVRNGNVESTIRREPGEGSFHSAYTFTPDGKFVISGGAGGYLALYDLRGNEVRRYTGHTGTITSLAVSPDSKTLVSGSSDQLIKMWDLEKQTGNLLGTTFVADDEWVTWIPEGYYVSSIRGDRYAGWQINNGLKTAVLARFPTYSEVYYDGSRVADKLGRHISPPEVPVSVPPVVEIERAAFQGDKLEVRARATSQRDEIRDIRIIVGGFQVPVISPATTNLLQRTAEASIARADWEERVQDSMITVEAEAQTRFATAASAKSLLKPPPLDVVAHQPAKVRLFVLSIGISNYQDPSFKLQHPADDAQKISEFFAKQKTAGLFQDVIVETLFNDKADRNQIIEKLDWLSKTPRDGDIRVLFLSGHGIMDMGDYYFGAYGYNAQQSVDVTSVSWNVIFRRFTEAAGKTLLIVDTCHAGGVLRGNTKGLINRQDVTNMLKKFARNTRGFVTIAASTSQETVPDDSVFFKALLRGLSGEAGVNKLVELNDLAAFVSKQVSDATSNMQHVIIEGLDVGWPLAFLP